VLNAETVWRVAQIVERGVDWFRSYGTAAEPGPRLASVSGAVPSPGVVETAVGVGVGRLIEAAGRVDGPIAGVGLGGLSGGWLTPHEAASAVWSRAGLSAYGLTPGPGTVHVLAADDCPLEHVSDLLDYASGETAGQCGPCMFGVLAVAADFALLTSGQADRVAMQRLRGRLGLLSGRGARRFPDGVAGYARSALRVFASEVDVHIAGGCTAGTRRSTYAVAG
jgi:NADH:ubiquinone oxidoreductase subunit F (NADH-binding)